MSRTARKHRTPRHWHKGLISLGVVLLASSIVIFFSDVFGPTATAQYPVDGTPEKHYVYGFDLDSFDVDRLELQPDQVLGEILSDRGISYARIAEITEAARTVYSVRQLRAGKPCAIIRQKGTGYVDCFVYEPGPLEYVLYHLKDKPRVEVVKRDVEVCTETAGGVIQSSLWLSMDAMGFRNELIARMEDALAWSVDFYHLQKGDTYKLMFEQEYVEGEPAGIGRLIGASFQSVQDTAPTYSIYFESGNYNGFYDLQGRPMKRAFLKAPVRYSRISSRYSLRRYHPVLKRYKGHFGTDYAAPHGTPIMAVADGTVTRAGYTGGNGNYVKIRHDEVYETQYLHMSRFARGIHSGTRVRQGDVIGYVGSTGLATGPHVCFRFWKHGRQVDHMRENLPPPEPMPAMDLPQYYAVLDTVIPHLQSIDIPVSPTP